jgi:hypothetical protein
MKREPGTRRDVIETAVIVAVVLSARKYKT